MNDTDPTHTFELTTSAPDTDVFTHPTAETAFNANASERTDSISSFERSHHLPSSKEDLSAVSQSDPDTLRESPHLNSHKSHDESAP